MVIVITVVTSCQQEVIRASREFRCCAGWNCCADSCGCAMELQVEAPVGQVIGYVRQRYILVWRCVLRSMHLCVFVQGIYVTLRFSLPLCDSGIAETNLFCTGS